MYYIYIRGELCCHSVFSGCCAALNSSLLPAFFSHLSTLNNPDTTGHINPDTTGSINPDTTGSINPDTTGSINPDTTGRGHNSFPEEYIWAIVGAVGGAAVALIIIMLLASILVVYATFKLKHRR